jgi:hypothetical protein
LSGPAPDAGSGSRPRAFAIHELLQALEPRLPRELVSASALREAQAFVAPLPACWDWLMLETRLGPDGGPVDLLACVTEAGVGRGHVRTALAMPDEDAQACLTGALPTLRAWAEGMPPMDTCGVLFLEWDAPLRRGVSRPLIFPSFDRTFWRAGETGMAQRTNFELLPWALSPDARAPVTTPGCEAVQDLVRALPEGAQVLSVVNTSPRGQAAARAFVRMRPQQVVPWLRAVGWPGDIGQAAHWVRLLYRPWDHAFVQMELLEATGFAPGAYLGLEPAQTSHAYIERAERMGWFDAAIRAGISSQVRAQAVLDWPRTWTAQIGDEPVQVCTSYHVKLVLREGRESAKAYLGAHLRAPPPA